MKNLCKEIFRKRLIIEAKYSINLDELVIENFINLLSKKIGMTIILGPIVKDLAGEVNSVHKGYEGIAVWAESGISVYTWNNFKFMTLDVYSCKNFDVDEVLEFTSNFFNINEIEYKLV